MKKVVSKFHIFLALLLVINILFTQTHVLLSVSGSSMYPTLKDRYLVCGQKFVSAERGAVYMVKEPDNAEYAIKRLIGLPGDHVEMVDGAIYINDELYQEAPGTSWDNLEWFLGVDEYIFMGDNRSVSYDSRHWSRPIHINEIVCQLTFIFYPFSVAGEVPNV